ncbi:hypothetical protein BZ166_12505 (plasmid) [Staphylococcus cohnii]|nr:hypothetical protein BZ166_12505 [Staphylococcus cohnii]
MRERYRGAKILSWVYLFLICFIYFYIYIFITDDMIKNDLNIQSLTLVIITSFIGTYSKQYYESMMYMIYNFELDLIPKEINRQILKVFAVINLFTVILLSSFISRILRNQVSIFLLTGIIALPSLLYIISLFFKFSDLEE